MISASEENTSAAFRIMTKRTRQIAFTANRKGQAIAYRWCPYGHRWFRTGYEAAKFAVATGEAIEVPYLK